jgi:hypothetical protein
VSLYIDVPGTVLDIKMSRTLSLAFSGSQVVTILIREAHGVRMP